MSQYAIGDIHGCNKTFNILLQTLNIKKGDALYLLGDYIDRGPDSKGVIDTIFELRNKGVAVTCLKGNHEAMLLDAYKNKEDEYRFLSNGGRKTLNSFGCAHVTDLPDEYIDFFQSLEYYHEVDNFILVHAGLNFKEKEPLLDTESLIWIRDWHDEIDYDRLGNRMIIHGHTPISIIEMGIMTENLTIDKFLNLDGGCYYGNKKNNQYYGYLCAFDLNKKKLFTQSCIDEISK